MTAAICVTAGAAAQPQSAKRAAVFVEWRCAGCHAVTVSGDSPVKAAPRFVDLAARYSLPELERRLTQGRHPHEMPPADVTAEEALDIAAYMKSLGPSSEN